MFACNQRPTWNLVVHQIAPGEHTHGLRDRFESMPLIGCFMMRNGLGHANL
jgi:hypothetical protein